MQHGMRMLMTTMKNYTLQNSAGRSILSLDSVYFVDHNCLSSLSIAMTCNRE
jgi:hypothetical protein